jgi:hypothetical protein
MERAVVKDADSRYVTAVFAEIGAASMDRRAGMTTQRRRPFATESHAFFAFRRVDGRRSDMGAKFQ